MQQTPTAVTVRTATAADVGPLAVTLVDAFLDGPDGVWLIADPVERRAVYERFCAGLIDEVLRHGAVLTTDDHSAVALWQSYVSGPPDLTGYDQLVTAACGPYADRFRQLDAVFADHHPATPHHYLAYLGVAPGRQRSGLGGALLAWRNTLLDRAGVAAYLVATSPGARDLYLRHGYRPHAAAFHLPDGGPPMWPMWRAPGGAR
ncbi:GNAT family N-acetyltransferase [Polymorphospora rubra]|uniref:GNAT family N-acetyltransferase n=1 Tax=Polymorphospora rubra TaxID=338584 RepID=UPI0033C9C946